MPIVPTPGSDALAAGMALVPGNGLASDIEEYINQTRDYIAQRTSSVTPVVKGGTGATTPAGARTALDVPSTGDVSTALGNKVAYSDTAAPGVATPNKLAAYDAAGRLATAPPVSAEDAVDLGTLAAHIGAGASIPIYSAGGPATNNYAVAYINGDGRISRGASSERYKKYITAIDPAALGDVFPELHRFQMRQGDGEWKYGYIAERLAESPDLLPFVVWDIDGRPDSIDFISLLMVQNAQLHQAVDLLTQRLEALEGQ
jgi:hypothetical protein